MANPYETPEFNQEVKLEDLPASLSYMWRRADPHPTADNEDTRVRVWSSRSDLLLKAYPAANFAPKEEAISFQLKDAEFHLRRLEYFGMFVVSHAFEARKGLYAALQRRPNTIVAYSAARIVSEAVDLDKAPADYVPRSAVGETVTRPLTRYLQWLLDSNQAYHLTDIYDAHQYAWTDSRHRAFLHNIDPLIAQLPPDRQERADHIEFLYREVKVLHDLHGE